MMPKTSAVLEAQNLGCAGQGRVSQGIGIVIMRGLEEVVLSLTREPSANCPKASSFQHPCMVVTV